MLQFFVTHDVALSSKIYQKNKELLILGALEITDWLTCHRKFLLPYLSSYQDRNTKKKKKSKNKEEIKIV